MANATLDVSHEALSMLHELSTVEHSSVQTVLERALDCYRRTVIANTAHLAPDGLPWPPGYFDCAPRVTFEAALEKHGVRPNHFHKGWPVYTDAEATRREFRSPIADEPQEVQEYWNAQWEKWEAKRRASEGAPQS